LGTTYSKGQIERALHTVSKTPAALTYKRAFVCGLCAKTMPCLGEVWAGPEPAAISSPLRSPRSEDSVSLATATDPPRQPQGATGVIHIVRRNPSFGQTRAPEYLVSFGGKTDGVGAFYLGKASGYDALAALLKKIGVPSADMDMALQVLMAEPHHEIPNVALTQALIRKLGL
jgi:hypothetical protein